MKLISKLLLLLCLNFIISCNEEIAEEIKNEEDISGETTVSFDNKSIRLINKIVGENGQPSPYSFYLHKEGTLDSACEIQAPALGFDADDYQKNDENYAIDCVLEVQELDLFLQGAKVELQVDDLLCEYIGHAPFKFMQYQPGTTTKVIHEVICDSTCEEDISSQCGRQYETENYDESNENNFFQPGVTFTNPYLEEPRCYFDYSDDNGPNCDDGEVRILRYELRPNPNDVVQDENGNDVASCATLDPAVVRVSQETIDCAGDNLSCLAGPSVDLLEDREVVTQIIDNSELNKFSQEFTYTAPEEKEYKSNMYLANYSRVCSDTSTDKTSANVFETLTFKGEEIEDFRFFTGSQRSETGYSYTGNASDANVLANSPFRSTYGTMPYYGFYCLDQARDVKAQIRLFIREWDKDFTQTDVYLARVSDAGTTVAADANMDNNTNQDTNVPWNSFSDWDDFYLDNNVFQANQCGLETTDFAQSNFPGDSL